MRNNHGGSTIVVLVIALVAIVWIGVCSQSLVSSTHHMSVTSASDTMRSAADAAANWAIARLDDKQTRRRFDGHAVVVPPAILSDPNIHGEVAITITPSERGHPPPDPDTDDAWHCRSLRILVATVGNAAVTKRLRVVLEPVVFNDGEIGCYQQVNRYEE